MLKFLLILFLVFYIIFRLSGYILKYVVRHVLKNAQEEHRSFNGQSRQRRTADGNINVDYVPNDKKGRKKSGKGDEEYIDYEEVD